ncbi:hypothetical protein [Gardnerella vaginalis]|uniref:hypothetical protein n=1 Tax=Gardnerella vaginalis TaxID=2702 RepID=UPI00094D409D|nr:hypothetical protein [Gardnerella vaginalis]
MTAPKYGFLKCACVIRDFVAHHYNSSVARESKRSSCATLRSNASKNASKNAYKSSFVKSYKNACTSHVIRALLSLFVACVTLLAAFLIAPTSALSASESATSTEKTERAKAGSTNSNGESNKQYEQSGSNSAELNKSNAGSSSSLKKNDGELKPVENQQLDSNSGVNKAKADGTATNQNAKDYQKKDAFTEAFLTMNRSVRKAKECSTLSACYNISYNIGSPTVDNDGKTILIKRGGEPRTITPKFELKPGKIPATNLLDGVWFELGKFANNPVPSWVNFEKTENGKTIKVSNTEKQKGFDGSVTLRPNGKWDYGSYRFKVFAYYKNKKEKISVTISVIVDVSDVPNDGDLTLSLYDFVNKTDKTPVSDNKIIIKPKSNSQGAGGTDKKDTYDSINNLFIDSKSTKKPSVIYHHMICHENGSDNYTLDSVNGLSLGTQTQFKHMENKDRPDENAEDSAVYESDPYTERSQSWISGTPTSAGTFECTVFAFKDANLKDKATGKHPSNLVEEFKKNSKTNEGKKSLFEGNIVDSNAWKTDDIKQGVDWYYKTITIQFGGKDLSLKVYPFKNANGSLPAALADGSYSFSLIRGAEINPFIDAISQSNNSKITLRMLCSKGEKKNNSTGTGTGTGSAGSTDGNSSAGSNGANTGAGSPSSPSGSQSSQSEQQLDLLEYKTWSTSIAGLGVTLPSDQEPCVTDSKGNTQCTSSDNKNVAARTNIEASIKPEEVGDYQCVVYALKQNVLESDAWKAYETSFKNNSVIPNGDSLLEGSNKAKFADFKQGTDWQKYMLKIQVVKFSLPNAGARGWNMFLSVLCALVTTLIAIYFVSDSMKRCHSILNGRRRC